MNFADQFMEAIMSRVTILVTGAAGAVGSTARTAITINAVQIK
jgi:FlaA1/EpsC-like NDP-sugar epimerase